MAATSRAVAMNVTRQNGMVIVSVVGHSAIPRVVRFVIDVDGRSTTRNLARSTVGTDSKTLSVVRFADLPPWQVTLDVISAERLVGKACVSPGIYRWSPDH